MNSKEIVVATDFSEVADNAVHFACTMGKELGLFVTVVHAYVLPVTFSETPLPIISLDETRSIAIEHVKELADKISLAHPTVDLHAKVLYGEVTDALQEYEKEHAPAFIIVGNSGSGNSSLWMGSNVISMMRQLKTIVIAVPPAVSFKIPRNMAFACDLQDDIRIFPVEAIQQLQHYFSAGFHLLNVQDVGDNHEANEKELLQFLQEFLPATHIHSLTSDKVDDAIADYVKHHEVNWLLMMPKKHSFLYKLFHTTHTEGLLKIDSIPIAAVQKNSD